MYKCEICNRPIFKKERIGGYTVCSKHMHQYHNNKKFLDNIPRTNSDLNNFRVEYELKVAIFDVYNQKNEKINEFIIDLEDLKKIMYHKWRIDANGRITTGNCTKSNPRRELSRFILDIDDENIVVDHIDGNPLNNKKENLRACTQSENLCNRHCMSNNTSGLIGLHWDKARKRWAPEIQKEDTRIHLGRYKKFEEAAYVRYIAEEHLFKEFQNKEHINLYKEYIENISEDRKLELKDYTITKINNKLNN